MRAKLCVPARDDVASHRWGFGRSKVLRVPVFRPCSAHAFPLVGFYTALSFIFGPLRSVTMGARIIMGVLTGFGFFITNEVFGPLSLVYNIPPALGALLPSLLFAGIATVLLSR